MAPNRARDIVVVGASAGGVAALRTLVAGLPANFPAAVLIVLHVHAGSPSTLAGILDQAGPLTAVDARQGAVLRPGTIHVAVADRHLLLDATNGMHGTVLIGRGLAESGHRPAVNALFRSAAVTAGPRVIGVVLSGLLEDGALGLRAVGEQGGLMVVQDPEDALYRGMPESALRLGQVDHVVGAVGLAGVLMGAVGKSVGALPAPSPDLLLEDEIARDGVEVAEPAGLECTGPGHSRPSVRVRPRPWAYRCRVEHAGSENALLAAPGEELQRALWAALRSLDEKTGLARRMEQNAADRGQRMLRERCAASSKESATAADVLRKYLTTPQQPGLAGTGDD